MQIRVYETKKVIPGDSLEKILDSSLPPLQEKDVVVITSKIVSICQGRVVKNDGTVDKHDLIRKEANAYIEGSESQYDVWITIKDSILIANAGIDESNGGGYFILWPHEPFKEAREIWQYLKSKHNLKHLGIIITDSRITPLRWGTLGIGIAWCGFEPLNDYRKKPDIFGRKLVYTQQSIVDGLAASAVLTMGEGDEQTPLAVISDLYNVVFQDRPPTPDEIQHMKIDTKDDIFAPLIDTKIWKAGLNLNKTSPILAKEV